MLVLILSFLVSSLPSQKVSAAACNNNAGHFSKTSICTNSEGYDEVLFASMANLNHTNIGRCRISSDAINPDFIFSGVKYSSVADNTTNLPSYHFSKSIGLRLIFPKHYFW